MKATQREVMCRASRYTLDGQQEAQERIEQPTTRTVGSTTENKAADA